MDLGEFYKAEIGDRELLFSFYGYSAVALRAKDKVVMFDIADLLKPSEVKRLDALFFTHSHYDHFNEKITVEVGKRTGAWVIAEGSVYSSLRGKLPEGKLMEAREGMEGSANDIFFKCVKGLHIGEIILYQVKIGDIYVFHGGDSGYVNLKGLRADVAFLPVGDPSPTASPSNALKMVEDLRPKVVVPIHGTPKQCSELEELVKERYPQMAVIIPVKGRVEKLKV